MRSYFRFKRGWKMNAAALFAASIAIAGCGSGDGEVFAAAATQSLSDEGAAPVMSVKIVKPKPATVRKTVVATGSIGSKQTSNIGPLVEGVVETIFVNVGDRVGKGDPLFQTRPVIYERRVEEAKAALKLAVARRKNAERALERTEKLRAEGFAAEARLDDARTTYDVAKAEVARAAAALKTAERQREDTMVGAPYDGVITKRFNDEGIYLSNVFRGGVESTVLQIQENHIVVAVVHAPEQHLNALRLNQKALVYVESQPEPRESYVLVLNDMLDVGSRTVELRLPIDNSDYSLKSGQFARAEIFTDERRVFSVPAEAVLQDQTGTYVLTLKNGRAEKRSVVIEELPDGTAAVHQGLDAGDDVIVANGEPIAVGDSVATEAA